VVDQGTNRVEDDPDSPMRGKRLGDQLRVIEQATSAGPAASRRGMYEAVTPVRSDYACSSTTT
jgi:hypothetical protein